MKPHRRLPTPGRRFWFLSGALALCIAIGSGIAINHHHHATAPEHATTPFRFGYQDSPPYQILNKDGSPGGIAIDIVREACRRRGIPVVWVNNEKGPDTALKNGTADLWPIIGDIPERHGVIYVTEPWRELVMCMITRPETGIQIPADTKGRTLAHARSRVATNFAGKTFPSSHLVPVITNRDVMEAVVTGKTDAGVIQTGKANGPEFAGILALHPEVKIKFYTLQEGGIPSGIGASYLRPDARAAADAIREEIGRMVADGTISSIYFSYYLDPNNEVSATFGLRKLQRQSALLKVSVGVLSALLILLGILTLLLQRSRTAAKTASRAKSEFLSNMSHEIRTPLNGVNGMIELALDCDSTAQQRDYLVTATQSVEMLVTIVDSIIDYSRMEAGVLAIENVDFDVRQLAETCTRTFALAARQNQIKLTVDLAPDCPRCIRGDPTRLRQLLSNLLSNALKYTEQGEIALRVSTSHSSGQPTVQFSVADTGIGITHAKQAQLFQAFHQADNSTTRKYGGAGLGLAICRRLVERMNGRIWCESKSGTGSTFHFTIPLVLADVPPVTAPTVKTQEPKKPGDLAPPLAPTGTTELSSTPCLHVLVAEDNRINQKVAVALLKKLGHTATLAANGREALERWRAEPFDLILMDVHMPEMDGLAATLSIRSEEASTGRHIPIIALTAAALPEDEHQCRTAGMDGYITKPVSIAKISSHLESLNKAPAANVRN